MLGAPGSVVNLGLGLCSFLISDICFPSSVR